MNINFELYKIFYVVAKNKNITKASEKLNISQPAISKSIKNLEEQLGGQLFIRTKRGVLLTEEGKEFYDYIKKAIEFINNAENRFSDLINLETGCIKIGTSTTLTKEFLLPFIKKFNSLYPNVNIQIIVGLTSDLISKLKNGLVDIVILNLNNKDYGDDIEIIKCKKIQDCFVVNDKYKHLINNELSLNDFNNYPLILQAKGSSTREFINNIAKDNNIILKPHIEPTSYSLVVEFAKIGLGIGYVTKEYVKSLIKDNNLYELNIKEKIPCRYIGIAFSKNHLPNFSTKKFIDIINEKEL